MQLCEVSLSFCLARLKTAPNLSLILVLPLILRLCYSTLSEANFHIRV